MPIYLRPVPATHIVLYDPTIADAVVVVQPEASSGGGWVEMAQRLYQQNILQAKIEREDEEITAVIAAFIQVEDYLAA